MDYLHLKSIYVFWRHIETCVTVLAAKGLHETKVRRHYCPNLLPLLVNTPKQTQLRILHISFVDHTAPLHRAAGNEKGSEQSLF